jgi:C-terminal processing protease CtpA/Prc
MADRPKLGVAMDARTCAVVSVKFDGVADRAGIKPGDVVKEIGGLPLAEWLASDWCPLRGDEDKVRVAVDRQGKRMVFYLEFAELLAPPVPPPANLGIPADEYQRRKAAEDAEMLRITKERAELALQQFQDPGRGRGVRVQENAHLPFERRGR